MLDANTVLHDGTEITADISPTSVIRTSGSAVLDLRESSVSGTVVALFQAEDLADTVDEVVVSVEESADLVSWSELARFDTIIGSVAPDTQQRKVRVTRRYLRAKIDVTDDDSGGDLSISGLVIALTTYGVG